MLPRFGEDIYTSKNLQYFEALIKERGMDISFIVILGLPVLYLTGSLKKIVAYTGASGFSFVLFFVFTALLSLLPVEKVIQSIRIDVAGAFFCIAPAVYLAVKKRYSYIYYLTFVLTTLLAVALSFFSNIYAMIYLPYLVGFVIAFAAILCFKANGPIFAPVMMGVFGAAGSIMQLFGGMDNSVTLFGDLGTLTLCAALCLFISYLFRTRGKHASRNVFKTQNNEG